MGERMLGSGKEMTAETVFAIFSTTKAITGTAIMQCVEEGKTTWNVNDGHFDQGPAVASGLSKSVEADDGDRTIVASRRSAPASPELAVGEASAPSRDALAGAAMSQQPEPSAKAQEATPPTAPAVSKLAVGEESAPSRDTLVGAVTSQQLEPSAKGQEATPPTAPAVPKLAVGELSAPSHDTSRAPQRANNWSRLRKGRRRQRRPPRRWHLVWSPGNWNAMK
jgi:hypothetical protein